MSKPNVFTEADLDRIRAALAEGRRATVYLREAVPSLGLAAGASARVLEISGAGLADASLTLRPAGVHDDLAYEAAEVVPRRPKPGEALPPAQTPARPQPAARPRTAARHDVTETRKSRVDVTSRRPAQRGKAPEPVRLTIEAQLDDAGAPGWTLLVADGRAAKPERLDPARVAAALQALGSQRAIRAAERVTDQARTAAQTKVEALAQELAQAKAALRKIERGR